MKAAKQKKIAGRGDWRKMDRVGGGKGLGNGWKVKDGEDRGGNVKKDEVKE